MAERLLIQGGIAYAKFTCSFRDGHVVSGGHGERVTDGGLIMKDRTLEGAGVAVFNYSGDYLGSVQRDDTRYFPAEGGNATITHSSK